MPLLYSKFVPAAAADQLDTVIYEVTCNLSASAHPDDDPEAFANEVVIEMIQHETSEGVVGTKVVGTLNQEPAAWYTLDGADPRADALHNPLSVPSTTDVPTTAEGAE